jgi:hypothetical protein
MEPASTDKRLRIFSEKLFPYNVILFVKRSQLGILTTRARIDFSFNLSAL